MATVSLPPSRCCFGVFEVDPASGELRKQGLKVRLTEQSFQILLALLERPGDVVTRQQLQERLWKEDTFVDVDASLNTGISLLRDALGDSAKNPRFIETLPRRGYRFLADVRREDAEQPLPIDAPIGADAAATELRTVGDPRTVVRTNRGVGLASITLVVLVAGVLSFLYIRPPARRVESIAVLPLVYAGPQNEQDQEYLADGLTSALITELARLGVPSVISETSVMRYKNAGKPLPAIARELGADVLVEGSVLREGNTVRVNAQLIDARSDTHLWAQSYQREMRSILQLQEEIAGAIVREIQTRLDSPVRAGPLPRPPVNARAHEAYLRGRHALRTEIEERRRTSIEFFNEAIRLDPTFAPAYQGLAEYYGFTDALPPEEALSNARRYALKALELDSTLAAAHLSLAQASWWGDWDWPATEREFRRALDLDPNDATIRRWFAFFLDLTGRPRTALAELRRVKELDPVSPFTYHALAHHFFLERRYDEALKHAHILQELSPHDPKAFESLAAAYNHTGEFQRAIELAERGIALWGRDPAFVVSLTLSHAGSGAHDKARELLAELLDLARKRHLPPSWFAMIYMNLGDSERAFEWLDKAFQARDGYLVHLKVSPLYDRVRGDRRFSNLLQRMNFPQYDDAAGTR